MLCFQLCSVHIYTVLQTKNRRRSTSAINSVTSKNLYVRFVALTIYIYIYIYQLLITFHFQQCSACFTALQTKNSSGSASAINTLTTENVDDSCIYKHRKAMSYHKLAPWAVGKRNGTQRRTKVSP